MKEKGILIEVVDAHPIIRKVAETNRSWDYSSECAKLYRRADEMMARFYSGVFTPQFPTKLPAPLIAVEPMNIRTLATYRVVLDEYGLPFKLTFNEKYFVDADGGKIWTWGEWSQMEILCHELSHHWQQLRGKDPFKPGKVTHNREFTDRMEELGIHSRPGVGSHYAVADAHSPFGILMKEWGIPQPGDVPKVDERKGDWWKLLFGDERKGQSSLTKWYCSVCSFAVRVGIKGNPQIIHEPCQARFIKG